jgi:rhomboid family GlyGly-CTERM serine protease
VPDALIERGVAFANGITVPAEWFKRSKWSVFLVVSLCALVLTYWPHGLMLWRYDRVAIGSGEFWRILSAHLVHLGTAHLFLNLFGFALLVELFWGRLPVSHGCGLLGASAPGISLCLWMLHPELSWYVGLSGALHGLWAGTTLNGLMPTIAERNSPVVNHRRRESDWHRAISLLGALLLIAKLAFEWRHGASDHTEQIIGAPVVTAAHLYGALIGGMYILIWRAAVLLHFKNRG